VGVVDASGEISNYTRVQYTQPWFSTFEATASSEADAPVSDVEIRIQHLINTGNEMVVDEAFGSVVLVTDGSGMTSTAIRVADAVNWYRDSQQFIVTPAKCSGAWIGADFDLRSCNGILHEFEPVQEVVSMKHMFDATTSFVDMTAFSIKGYVIFGEDTLATSSTYRQGYVAADWDDRFCPKFFRSACYCPIEEMSLELSSSLEGKAMKKELLTDARGLFTETVGMNEEVSLQFLGYEGHTFELWNVTGGSFTAEVSDVTFDLIAVGPTPNVTFTAKGNSNFVLVDVQPRNLTVQVLGGDDGVRFITGQRVLAERGICGYRKQLVVNKGQISSSVIAAELHVHIPNDATSETNIRSCSEEGPVGVLSDERSVDTACRVLVPQVASNSSRLLCGSSSFTYIDEYFASVGASELVDLGTTPSNTFKLTFMYVGPLCLKASMIALQSDDMILQRLGNCGSGYSTRTWPPPRFDGINMEALLMRTPTVDESYEETEFGKADGIDERAIFCEADKFNISFSVVEVYPTDEPGVACDWPEDFFDDSKSFCKLEYFPENDYAFTEENVEPRNIGVVSHLPSSAFDISVSVYDGISGSSNAVQTEYDVKQQWGYNHTVVPGDPNPFAPFTNIFELVFERAIHGGRDSIEFVRRAVTLGVVPEDVPQVLTMTTDPSLIFAVLHDPPGGGSSATLVEGTTLSVTMNIDGKHAGDMKLSSKNKLGFAFAGNIDYAMAPMGLGVLKRLLAFDKNVGFSFGNAAPNVDVTRRSSQGFDLGFSFDYELSTSSNPQTAGQPSDIIVGGGMNLRIQRASKFYDHTAFH
jgi:hypothetical protein